MSTKPKFQLSSIKYQNLSHRMQRLRHSQNHSNSSTNIRSASVDKPTTLDISSSVLNKPLNRNVSSTLLVTPSAYTIAPTPSYNNLLLPTNPKEQISCLQIGNRNLGKVARNTGIKKYNQRMLKEIGNINSSINSVTNNQRTPTKYSGLNDSVYNKAQNYTPQKEEKGKVGHQNFDNGASRPYERYRTQVNNKNHEKSTIIKNPQQSIKKLQPGQIYSRDELEKYFNCQK